MERFLPLDPSARRVLTFSFSKDLSAGDTIAAATVDVSLASGTDETPAALKVGDAAVVGTDVLHMAAGRPDGNAYVLKCLATTSNGEILALSAVITMQEGA